MSSALIGLLLGPLLVAFPTPRLTLHLERTSGAAPPIDEVIEQLAMMGYSASVGMEQPQPRLLQEEELLVPGTTAYYINLIIVLLLIVVAALMAGLQMGLMSIDSTTLRLKEEEGSAEEQRAARAVSSVLHNRHHLLVALLLCNAAANEALPIFLDALVPSAYAILVSVTCVLIFGEILPSAVMLGPRQLMLAAGLAPVVRALMFITAPISVPIAKVLDYALGSHDGCSGFKRNEFKALIRIQARAKGWTKRSAATAANDKAAAGAAPLPKPLPLERQKTPAELRRHLSGVLQSRSMAQSTASPAGPTTQPSAAKTMRRSLLKGQASAKDGQPLPFGAPPGEALPPVLLPLTSISSLEDSTAEFSDDEVTILSSVFSLQSKRVFHLLEPARNTWESVRMIRYDSKMDMTTMQLLQSWGNSRVPVYAEPGRNNVRGILLVKEHLALDPDDTVPVSSLKLRYPVLMHPDTSTFDALNIFQTGKSHMALITPHGTDVLAAWQTGRDVPAHVKIFGVCTIEDVIEEIIGEEILDDTDQALTPRELQARDVGQAELWTKKGILTMSNDPSKQATAPTVRFSPTTEAARSASFGSSDPLLPRGLRVWSA